MLFISRAILASGLALSVWLPAASQDIDIISIKPTCPTPFKAQPDNGKCVIDSAVLGTFKDKASCESTVGLAFDSSQCMVKGEAPTPNCGTLLPDLTYKNGACVIDRSIPRSATGDYEGDYFRIIALSADHTRIRYQQDQWIHVLSQRKISEQDSELTVIRLIEPPRLYRPDKRSSEPARTVRASDLEQIGATRVGWTYGALALPFKYYPGEKRFKTNVSIGPYVGRRYGIPGSAFTVAATAAIGAVTGEVRDADNNVTSTPELMAFSLAAGVMWDLNKSPAVKPFKIGLFVGKDRASTDKDVTFQGNRKRWVSFQIGYDFTEN